MKQLRRILNESMSCPLVSYESESHKLRYNVENLLQVFLAWEQEILARVCLLQEAEHLPSLHENLTLQEAYGNVQLTLVREPLRSVDNHG